MEHPNQTTRCINAMNLDTRSIAPGIQHPISALATQLLDLPPELLNETCTYLSRDDLRSLSQICKVLRPGTLRELFSTIHLKPNLDSFQKLTSISKHATLRGHVKRISYDGKLLGRPLTEDLGAWLEDEAAVDFGFHEEDRKEHLKSIDEETLRKYFTAYLSYGLSERQLCESVDESELLRSALSKFTNLVALTYFTVPRVCIVSCKRRTVSFPPKGFGFVEDKTLVEPYEWRDSHFWALVISMLQAGQCNHQTEIGFKAMVVSAWNNNIVRTLEYFRKLGGLRTLSLDFGYASLKKGRKFKLLDHLTFCPSLQKLNLAFDTNCTGRYQTSESGIILGNLIDSRHFWKDLESLSLEGLEADKQQLRSILQRHSPTLRSLEFRNIHLTGVRAEVNSSSSWIEFLIFLHENLSLRYFSCSGRMSTSRGDCWWGVCAHDSVLRLCSSHEQTKFCLKRQVELYVIRRGQFPFKAVPLEHGTVVDEATRFILPWSWTQDDIWTLLFDREILE